MFPLKPGAHIQVDVFVFTDMLARGQARGFGQWKPRLMFFPTIMPHSHWVHGTKLACNIHIGIKFRQKNGTKFFCSTTLSCPSSLATSRWKWHCICLCHSGTVRSAVPHCDWRWSFPWCSSRRPSPDHTWCIQRHHFGCSLRKNHRSPCRGPWTPDTLTNEGNAGGSWWIWIWHCVTWSAKELRMTKISMRRSQWHSSGSLWPPLPWKERRIQNAHVCFDNISEMFLLLWVSTCWRNMTNPMISELFLSFEVLQTCSSNAAGRGAWVAANLSDWIRPYLSGRNAIAQHGQTCRNGNLRVKSTLRTICKTRPWLTEALIVTSPLDTSMPAAEALETTNLDASSVAPAVAVIRDASALQRWSWNAPPSILQAVTAITSPPQENSEENIPAQTHMVTWATDEITCLWEYAITKCGGSYIGYEGSPSRFRVQGNFLLLCSSTNFVRYSHN